MYTHSHTHTYTHTQTRTTHPHTHIHIHTLTHTNTHHQQFRFLNSTPSLTYSTENVQVFQFVSRRLFPILTLTGTCRVHFLLSSLSFEFSNSSRRHSATVNESFSPKKSHIHTQTSPSNNRNTQRELKKTTTQLPNSFTLKQPPFSSHLKFPPKFVHLDNS